MQNDQTPLPHMFPLADSLAYCHYLATPQPNLQNHKEKW